VGKLCNVRTIRTQRLRLVPVTTANAGVLWELLQEPDLRDYQDLPDVSRAQFLRVVGARPARFVSGAFGRFEWLLHHVQNGDEPLGWVSMRIAELDRQTAEIGYSVVRAHRRKGLASEAVAALVEEGFRHARLREIRAYCLPENLSSRAVLRHNGFDDEGTLTRGATVQGKPVDVILHSLERERWNRLTANPRATRS
jgi:ribosomal-protein-alanine N-acetyltransferase